MLVLARQEGQFIEIADGLINIVVVSIEGDIVKLGIDAPADIPVHRREIAESLRRWAAGGSSAG